MHAIPSNTYHTGCHRRGKHFHFKFFISAVAFLIASEARLCVPREAIALSHRSVSAHRVLFGERGREEPGRRGRSTLRHANDEKKLRRIFLHLVCVPCSLMWWIWGATHLRKIVRKTVSRLEFQMSSVDANIANVFSAILMFNIISSYSHVFASMPSPVCGYVCGVAMRCE